METFVRLLEELDLNSLPEAGGKGANLGVLVKAGLPVPPGFTVTALAYRTHLDAAGLRERIARRLDGVPEQDLGALTAACRDVAAWIEAAPMPATIQDQVAAAYARLAGRMAATAAGAPRLAVAVRSSATAEDLPSASFAGQQETYLGVCGTGAVLEHVRKCWASLWTPQAVSYRAGMGFAHLKVDLAVVVQAMVRAEAAGVMFTANPVSGARDEILVSASYGLGEAVVSGMVTPDTLVLSADGAVRQRTLGSKERRVVPDEHGTRTELVPGPDRNRFCLSAADLSALAALARQVEAHYGSPQDTEWALAGGAIFLLQARPITTLTGTAGSDARIPAPLGDPLWHGRRPPFGIHETMEHFPDPLTPLDVELYCIGDRAIQESFRELGMRISPTPTAPVERENGCVAARLQQPRLSLALLWRLPANLLGKARMDPRDRWQPVSEEMASWLRRMEAVEGETGDAPGLVRLIGQAVAEFEPLLVKRFSAVFMCDLVSSLLTGFWVRRAVGKESAAGVRDRLLRALPFRTALQNQALAGLARVAAAQGMDTPAFAAALAEFLEEYGHRPASGMVPVPGSPTWQEDPGPVMGLVRALLNDPASINWEEAHRQGEADFLAARARVESALSRRARRWFRTHLERARNGVVVREESLFVMERLIAFMRRVALRLGDLLTRQSILDEPGDVFFLFQSELLPAAAGTLGVRERVQRRKHAFAQIAAAHRRGQHWLITTGSIPPPAAAPGRKPAPGSPVVTGLAASRGEAAGTVCVVRGPAEFGKLRKGDILVAPFTAPAWTPLFRVAAAVVTDLGSPVSHAAIVAREYGIPAVVATANATALLRDGQQVRVDGTGGVVMIL